MDSLVTNFFNLGILQQAWPYLLKGLGMTLLLCIVVIPLGVAGGLAVALASRAPKRWMRWAVIAYVDFFRAFPPLVLLMFIAFGLPFLGLDLPAFVAVALAFLLNTSSYYGEIFRAGIESISRGQYEAARSLGLSAPQYMRAVILPQAVRNVLPDLIGNTLEVIAAGIIYLVCLWPLVRLLSRYEHKQHAHN